MVWELLASDYALLTISQVVASKRLKKNNEICTEYACVRRLIK